MITLPPPLRSAHRNFLTIRAITSSRDGRIIRKSSTDCGMWEDHEVSRNVKHVRGCVIWCIVPDVLGKERASSLPRKPWRGVVSQRKGLDRIWWRPRKRG